MNVRPVILMLVVAVLGSEPPRTMDLPAVAPAQPVVAAPADYLYWRSIWAKVTAYTPSDELDAAYHAKKGKDRWKTSTGVDVRRRPYGVAVDPRAIPYGTPMIVPGYKESLAYVTADDTGGKMRQSWAKGVVHVDVRYVTDYSANKWGVRKMLVYVLVQAGSDFERQLDELDRRNRYVY